MGWTAGVEMAAEIEVAVAEDFGDLEVLDDVDGRAVEKVVVVPCEFVGVHE